MDSIIIGTTDLANQLYFHIKKYKIANVVAFAVNRDYIQNDRFLDLPVIDIETMEQHYPPNQYNIYIAIGYTQMNQIRQNVYQILKAKGYKFPNFIHPTVKMDCESIGEANIVLSNTILDCFVKIGNGNIFHINATISHNSIIGDFNFFAVRACVCGFVRIGNCCFIGANSTIKNGIIVNDNSIIGAGAYLSKDSNKNSVIVPATSIFLSKTSDSVKLK